MNRLLCYEDFNQHKMQLKGRDEVSDKGNCTLCALHVTSLQNKLPIAFLRIASCSESSNTTSAQNGVARNRFL